MIIARDEPHAPEIEAARPGFNVLMCDSANAASLADALGPVSDQRAVWFERAEAISTDCANRYSIERMVDGFVSAIGAAS